MEIEVATEKGRKGSGPGKERLTRMSTLEEGVEVGKRVTSVPLKGCTLLRQRTYRAEHNYVER